MADGTQVGSIYYDLDLDDKKFNQGAERAQVTFGTIAKGALAFVGVQTAAQALGGAIAGTIGLAGDFEQSLNILGSVTGATAGQMTQLQAKARELGQDISLPGVSAADAALAMTELGKAGLGVNDILGASKGVLSLAKAGNLDVAEAASIAANALNAFSLQGTDATKVADILAGGANASSAGVQDLALALQQTSASASRLKVPLGDTVTALGLFANNGIAGSDAGTSLKTMFSNLIPQTEKQTTAMKNLGLNFFDAKGNFVGLRDTAEQLKEKLSGLTQQQKEQALITIFGSDSSRAASILAKEGAAGFDKLSASVNKAGAATELAAAQNSGFKGAMDAFKSTIETVATDLGMKLLPPLTQFVKLITNNLATTATIVAGAIAGIGVAALIATPNVWALAAGVIAATWPFIALAAAGAALAVGIAWLQKKFDIFGKTMAFLKPIFSDISVIARLLFDTFTGGDPTIKSSEAKFAGLAKVLAIVSEVVRFTAATIGEAFDALKSIFQQLATSLRPVFDAFKQILANSEVQKALKYIGIALLVLVSAPVIAGFALLIGALKLLQVVLSFVADHFEVIKKTVIVVIAVALLPLTLAIGAIIVLVKEWSKIMNFFKSIPGAVAEAIDNFANSVVNLAKSVGDAVVGFFKRLPGYIMDALKAIPGLVMKALEAMAFAIGYQLRILKDIFFIWGPAVVKAVIDELIKLPGQVASILVSVWNTAWFWFWKIRGDIHDAIWSAVTAVVNFFIALPGQIASTAASLWNSTTALASTMWHAMVDTAGNMYNSVINFFAALPGQIMNWAGSLWGASNRTASSIWHGIMDTVYQLPGLMGQVLQSIWDKITGWAGAMYNGTKKVADNIWRAFKDGLGIHSPSYLEKAMDNIADKSHETVATMADNVGMLASLGKEANAVTATPASALNMGQTTAYANLTINGDFNFANQNDIGYFFSKLGRNVELTQQGLTATR